MLAPKGDETDASGFALVGSFEMSSPVNLEPSDHVHERQHPGLPRRSVWWTDMAALNAALRIVSMRWFYPFRYAIVRWQW